MWLLLFFVVANFGWQLFHDGPLANYIITGLVLAALCGRLALRSKKHAIVYLYGGAMGLMTSGCGGMFSMKADGYRFLCDKGTGLPVSMITGLGALAVAMHLLARGKK